VDVIKPKDQSGFSLTEALVAFTVIAIGLLAVASFQSGLFKQSAYNKAQTEALALAQQKIEQLKHYTLADEEAYIDEDGDGVMDANGNYTENPITGRNAVFQRSWQLGSTNLGRQVEVTVAWRDAENELQEVSLSADVPWISPRTAADQIVELVDSGIISPTGRASLGDGHIDDIPDNEIKNIYAENGLDIYQHKEDLLLANLDGDILLTLKEACSAETDDCTDFVRIEGTVYLDTANTDSDLLLEEIELLASDAAFCQRWVPEGSLSNPPTTIPDGNYQYYHYTCYLGGGWHGNIGFVTRAGLKLIDKVCQGDPTAFESEKRPVIALRRVYRGMISKEVNGETRYYSHGIRDAAHLTGQDYVFTRLDVDKTEGYHCSEGVAPMTRFDSDSGRLFRDVPTDFVCLNLDDDSDGSPDYLDAFDTREFSADTTCREYQIIPPVFSYQISGGIYINSDNFDISKFDPGNFAVQTSDGPNNCVVNPMSGTTGTILLDYTCTIFDWGSGWTGEVRLQPGSQWVYCPSPNQSFEGVTGDDTWDFSCTGGPTITIEGPIEYFVQDGSIQSITIEGADNGPQGRCELISTKFRCVAPYFGDFWSGTLSVVSDNHVCDWTSDQSSTFSLTIPSLTVAESPRQLRITLAENQASCPIP
jgi:Tfp pilus assembly protein PilV